MNRETFINQFNAYFEKNETKFFHFSIETRDSQNKLEFKENLYQKFIPFFESINMKDKYDILDKVENNKRYDAYYEEDNPDSEFCSFACKINLNDLYDVIKKVEGYQEDKVEIFRIESESQKGLYDTFFASLPVDEIHHPNPRKDPQFVGIFDNHNNDHYYYQKWSFAFSNLQQLKDWLITEENVQKVQDKGCVIKKITIDKDYVIEGNKQLIYKKEEKLNEEIVSWNLLNITETNSFDIECYKNMSKYGLESEVAMLCEKGDLLLIKKLLEHTELDINIHCFHDCFLMKSVQNGHLEIVKYLLTSPNLKENSDIHAWSECALNQACAKGQLHIVKYLLTSNELKENSEIGNSNGEALKEACENGHLEIVKYLLTSPELKQHANIEDNKNIAFRNACEKLQFKVIEYLLTSSDLKEKFNVEQHGLTPMIIACNKDSVELAKLLLDSPGLDTMIDIHQHDDTIFRNAIYTKAVKMIDYLVFEKNIKQTECIKEILKEKPNEIVEKWFFTRDLKNKLEDRLAEKNVKNKMFKM